MQRLALTGLLVICVLLAAGLGLTAVLADRAAARAAEDVLYSRATELGATLVATARWSGALENDEELRKLVSELGTEDIGLAVVDPGGRVIAAAGRGSAGLVGARLPAGELMRGVRGQGRAHRLVAGSHLEYWRPIRGPGGFRRGPWARQPFPPPPDELTEPGAREGPPDGGPPPWGGQPRLLRVTVSLALARSLLDPARLTLTLAGATSLALLALSLVLHRAARRAQEAEAELRRRQALAAVGEMAAVLAHEIRTPLGSIKGNAQLIGERAPEDDRARSIVDEAGRLERLVNGLLDYARPAPPHRVPTDPDALMERAAQLVAPQAASAAVDLVTDPARSGASIEVDPDQLLQVLVNLLQNAIEASSSGAPGGPVVVRARQSGSEFRFTVLDSGVGLAPGSDAQIFRPFFTTKQRGTGLGLTISRRIVEEHGGKLELTPRKEGGLAATVELPARARS